MVGFDDTPVTMETSVVDFPATATDSPRTPALDWKEFFGE